MTGRLLRPEDAAALVGRKRAWAYKQIANGTFMAVHLGGPDGPLRVTEESVEAYKALSAPIADVVAGGAG